LIALRWRQIDFERGILTVEDSKSGESRRIPLHRVLIDELKPQRGLGEGFVIDTMIAGNIRPYTKRNKDEKDSKKQKDQIEKIPDPAKPLTRPQSISHAFRRAADAIGRPDLRWHDTRHLAGSRLLATGASLPEVAATLGHKTLAMSKRYSHVSPVRLATLIDAMPAPVESVPEKPQENLLVNAKR
jgi:integrase